MTEEQILEAARQAELLFNEDAGTDRAQQIHKQRLLKFAQILKDLNVSVESTEE